MVVRSKLRPATRASTNSTIPMGGCSRPIIRFSTITRPKWIGSTPSFMAMGSRMGTRMVMAAVGSRKQPTNSISRLASSRNTQASLVKPSTQAAMSVVTPVAVSIQPKIDAAATMNNTVDVVSIVSRQTLTNIFHFRVRYQANPRIRAQTQAAMAPSVGVNRPVVMPPISSTGVMMGSSASNLKILSSTNSEASPANTVSWGGVPSLVTSSHSSSGQPTTTASSHRALKNRVLENLMSPPHLFLWAK